MTAHGPPDRGGRRSVRRARGRLDRLLAIGAGVLLAWSLSVVVPWASSVGGTLAATAPGLAVPALGLIAVALPRRRWVSAAAALLAAALPWALVVGYASPGDDPAGGTVPLRVMTFNAHLGEADAGELVEAARTEDVDVLVVIEASSRFTNRLAAAGIGATLPPVHVSDNPDERTNQLVVYTRLPVLEMADLENESGPVVEGTLATAAGPVRIVAAHATSPVRDAAFPFLLDADLWQRDLRTVARAARAAVDSGDAVVVLGDLNATPWHPQFRALERDGGVEDAADLLGHGLQPTWPTLWNTGGVIPLDHVLVGPSVGVRSLTTVVVPASDHAAVVADLRLTAP